MHVIHVIVGLGAGGAEHMLQRLVLAQRSGTPAVDCTVVSLTTIGSVGQALLDAGVEVVPLGMASPFDLPRTLWRLRRLLQDRRPDVVQTWMAHADLLGGAAARWAGIRAVVWGIRSTGVAGASAVTRVVRRACALLSHRIPHTIVCAAEASRRSHARIGYDTSRMVVIPNGFDVERFRPDPQAAAGMRAVLGLDPADVVVGHVGRWNAAKDHLNFVRAAGMLAGAHGGCRFLMVGRDVDPANAVLRRAVAQTGHGDRFLLLGERSDMPACLAAMDLFCLSSRAEGFPNVVGEAMAMEVPCVVTDVGDAALLVGDTGWVVPSEDPLALSRALHAAVTESRVARQARGSRARARIIEEFSMQRAQERFGALLRSVAAQTRKVEDRCAD